MILPEIALPATSFGRPAGDMVIVYDGECPFCTNFVALQKLRENVGVVSLIDARQHLHDVRAAKAAGLDVDQGMLVFWNGRIHEGPDAVRLLAQNGTEAGIFPSITRVMLSGERTARLLYRFSGPAETLPSNSSAGAR